MGPSRSGPNPKPHTLETSPTGLFPKVVDAEKGVSLHLSTTSAMESDLLEEERLIDSMEDGTEKDNKKVRLGVRG